MPTAFADSAPGEQATKNGFKTCQKTVESIAQHLTKDGKHSAISTWNKRSSDNRMFNSQLAISYTDGNAIAIINVAPVSSGKCDGSYTRITNWDKSCSVLRETNFKDWKFFSELSGLVSLENTSGSVSTVLLPSQNGCTTIQTEVVYE